jgi:drug/metabolite transporter (DMT)-like permease
VASFSFLTPVFAILFGVVIYGEEVTLPLVLAATLVGAGIVLINRAGPAAPLPAPVPEIQPRS